MNDLLLQNFYGGAEGGAIYNKGDIVVDGEAEFTSNIGGVRVVYSYMLHGHDVVCWAHSGATLIGRTTSKEGGEVPRHI